MSEANVTESGTLRINNRSGANLASDGVISALAAREKKRQEKKMPKKKRKTGGQLSSPVSRKEDAYVSK